MAKFPWGDEAMWGPGIFILVIMSAVLVGGVLAYVGPDGAVAPDSFPGPRRLGPAALVTVVYGWTFFATLGQQMGTKKADDSQLTNIGARILGNTFEQMPMFLLSMWMHAAFVNPRSAAILGSIYVGTRFLYGPAYGWYGQMSMLVELVTQPNYAVILYGFGAVLFKVITASDLHEAVAAKSQFLLPLVVFGCHFVGLLGMGTGQAMSQIAHRGVHWDKKDALMTSYGTV